MAEAIAALSLASNILQVIDFGSKFASTAWKIYQVARQSVDGVDEVASLRAINVSLSDVLREIHSQCGGANLANDINQGIINLAKECAKLVEELQQSLKKLGIGDVLRKRDVVYAAFKLTWKREEIQSLQARLNDLRSQLTLGLLVSMRLVFGSALAP